MKHSVLLSLFCLILLANAYSQEDTRPFITTWNVPGEGSFDIPLSNNQNYNFEFYVIQESDTLSFGTHTNADGTFDFFSFEAITVQLHIYGQFPHFQGYPKGQLLDVLQWGDIVWESMFQTFNDWRGTGFSATDAPDLSQVINMGQMFFRASSFNDDISDWDVGNIMDMTVLFRGATAFNQDLSTWDLRNVTNTAFMFENADAFNQDLSTWNVSNVNNMTRMFNGADSFNQDLGSWDVSRVGNMTDMLDNTDLSAANYDNTLAGWSALPNLRRGVDLDATGIEACEAEIERFSLINDFNWNITDGGTCNQAINILSFEIDIEQVGETVIDFVNHTIALEVFSDADITALTPISVLSEGASSIPTIDISQDFTNPVTYTVTAEDGATVRDWTVNVAFTDQRPFITSWGTLGGESITIELNGGFDYNFSYSWKDIDGIEITSGRHTSSDGDFVTDFTEPEEVTLEIIGAFPHLTTNYPKDQLLDVVQWGDIAWESMASSFQNWPGTGFSATDDPDLSNVTNMSLMFRGAANFDDDINDWQVGKVTNMSDLFLDAVNFNSNISDWDVSSVTNMRRMFFRSDAFNQDLSEWNVSQVRDMREMFSGAESFTSDLSGWNVNGVTSLEGLFRGASNFNSDLNDWDVSQVTNMVDVFQDAQSFNGNIGTWNVENVTDMESMFDNADAFNQDLDEWNVSNVRDMSFMFRNNGGFNGNISTWKVDSVTTMFRMFQSAGAFNQDLTNWNPASLNTMFRMFDNAGSFNGDISTWNVESVTNMAQAFVNADSFNQDLSGWDVSSVTTMTNMFNGTSLTPQNYDQTLIAWADLEGLQPNVSLGALGITFCKSAAARGILTNPSGLNWDINDGDEFCLDETDFLSFEFEEGFFDSEINATNHTIQAVVTFDADVASLSPFITLSPGATVAPDSEQAVDFTDPVEYIVTAEDGITTERWTIAVLSQPANDFCTGAITVNADEVVTGNTTFASNDANIASNCGNNFVDDGSVGVWYHFVGNGETITLNTCTGDKYDFDDTSVSVYTGSCSEGLSCLTGNEDAGIEGECGGSGFQARLSFNSEIGADYFILVDGFGDNSGEFDLSITSEPTLPPPANDNCEEAEALTVFADGAGTPTEGTNADATTFTRTVDCEFFGIINDVWYTFNSGANTEVSIELALTDTDEAGELVAAGFINYELYADCDGEGLDICESDGASIIEVTPNTDYLLQLWNNPQSEGTFTIQINDGPNTAAALSFENAVANTLDISRFAETGAKIEVVIADDDEGHAQLFSITGGNAEGIFAIDEESGAITIADATLLSASASTSFALTLQSEDQGPGEVSSEITLTVNVLENAPPVVTNEVVFIAENTSSGTFIATFEFSDPDGDDVFPIETSTNPEGILSVDEDGNVAVLDESLLDFEVNPSIEVTFTVRDNGPLALEATGTIIVNLNDVNEAPVLEAAAFDISSFSENGFLIGTIPFTDQDAGQTHTYAIFDDGDGDGAIFSIDAATGELTVLDQTILSANSETTYTFDVEVTDDGETPLSGTAAVTINTFSNNAPVINSSTFVIDENTSNGTVVGTIAATDLDEDNITFSLEDETTVFEVEANGEITVSDIEALDFETNPFFEIRVAATDNGIGSLKTTKTIIIQLNDVNEVPELASAIFDISSFSQDGSILGQVSAKDPDGDILSYTIASGNKDEIFAIDPTGILSISKANLLNPITTPRHVLIVEANDGNLTANTEITINVFLNNSPVLNTVSFSIDENSRSGALIGALQATDSDGIDSYKITSGNENGLFEINETTGELNAANDVIFNFEETQEYELVTMVTDEGIGNLSTSEILTISINDVNEFDPVINEVNGGNIIENSAVGTVAARVVASDDDSFQTLAYNITAGNDEGFFAIDANGEISLLTEIDFEQDQSFSLIIEVSDNLDPIRTVSQTINVNINDVNESPVMEAITDQTGSIGSTLTFAALANDPEGDEIIFSIDEGSTQLDMEINAVTGIVTWTPITGQFGSFELIVTASDGASSAAATATITILNNQTDILTFELAEQTDVAIIDVATHTVAIEVANGTELTNLTPNITLSEGASINPAPAVPTDFSTGVAYTVTAEDNITEQEWLVTVTEAANTTTDILSVNVVEEDVEEIFIDDENHSVNMIFSPGTALSSIEMQFTFSEGAASSVGESGTFDLTAPLLITVTAEDGISMQDWTVTAEVAANTATDILSVTLVEEVVEEIIIDDENHSVNMIFSPGTALSSIEMQFTFSEGATSSVGELGTFDLTAPSLITVTAEDETSTQDWTVTAEVAVNTATDILLVTLVEEVVEEIIIDDENHTVNMIFSQGTSLSSIEMQFAFSVGAASSVGESGTFDLTTPLLITVTAEDGITTQDWTVTAEVAANTATDILSVTFVEEVAEEIIIDDENHTVNMIFSQGTSLSSIEMQFAFSVGAASSVGESGTFDLTTSLLITVTAEDGITTQDWTVTAEVAANTATDILSVTFVEQVVEEIIIDDENHTVNMIFSQGTSLSSIEMQFAFSEGAVSSVGERGTFDLTTPLLITVTAEDGITTQDWTLTAAIEPNSATDIIAITSLNELTAITINETTHTVNMVFAVNTDLSTVVLEILLSEGATSSVDNIASFDLTNLVEVIVTAEDQITSQEWTLTGALEEVLNTRKEQPFIIFFPNPVQDVLKVSNLNQAKISMIDLQGKVVFAEQNGTDLTIMMRSLKAGIYILQVRSADRLSTFKVIKQ